MQNIISQPHMWDVKSTQLVCQLSALTKISMNVNRCASNNFNTHFIDSKPCKSMHLVKLKLIQGNIIPIRIFHQCCKSSNEPSSTIMVMHCSTAALHTMCKFTIILSTFHTPNTLLDYLYFIPKQVDIMEIAHSMGGTD